MSIKHRHIRTILAVALTAVASIVVSPAGADYPTGGVVRVEVAR